MHKLRKFLLAAVVAAMPFACTAGSASAAAPGWETYYTDMCQYHQPDYDTPVDQLAQYAAEDAVWCLTNDQRVANGLTPLAVDFQLDSAARGHANDAVAIQWWCPNACDSHTNPQTGSTPKDRIRAAGYCPNPISWSYAENTFYGISTGAGAVAPTPRAAVNWWMTHLGPDGTLATNGHRKNILNPNLTDLGVAVVIGNPTTAAADAAGTFVEDFGTCTN